MGVRVGGGSCYLFKDPVTIKIATDLQYICLSHPPAYPPPPSLPCDRILTQPIGCFTIRRCVTSLRVHSLLLCEVGTCRSH